MARKATTQTAAAEVSISTINGTLYLGIGVREQLSIGYNDEVVVEVPSAGERISGYVDAAGSVYIGKETARSLSEAADTTEGGRDAEIVDAEVQCGSDVWEDANGGPRPRRDSVPHHSSQVRNW